MKQISSPDDNLHHPDSSVQAKGNLNITYFSKLLTIYQYSLVQLSRQEFYRLRISARNLGYVKAIAILFSLLTSTGLLYHFVNSQKLDIANQAKQSSQYKAKLIGSPVVNVTNASIPAIKSRNLLKNQKASSQVIAYNVQKPPQLSKGDKKLNSIVNELVDLALKQNLPTEKLSITLIDIDRNRIAGYQQHIPRYPASVVKLFWMVALEAEINQGLIANNKYTKTDLKEMILKSDNDAASRIVDTLTRTKSSQSQLSSQNFIKWKNRRQKLNRFFQKAEYKNINVSQKTLPISEPNMMEPEGTELQLLANSSGSTSNQITTYHAARLMYEIFTEQAISKESSQKMADLLKRDLNPQAWKNNPPSTEGFNPVENLFGESLSQKNIDFASKAGINSTSRHEVAYIATKDGKARYIIAAFGKDVAYSESNTIFPDMSQLVFKRMTNQKY